MTQTPPALSFHTIALPDNAEFRLIDHLPEGAFAFLRNGDGLVGSGVAARLVAKGPNRINDLAEQWRQIVSTAQVIDEVSRPGTGLVAFGSFAFADDSTAESILVIPRVIVGTRDGQRWLTRVAGGDDANFWDEQLSYRTNQPVRFIDGEQTASRFLAAVNTAVQKIDEGEIEKVVIARDLKAGVDSSFDLRPVLQTLAQRYPSCWTYSVEGLFGASPELLLRVAHKQVSARVLAGTAARGTDPDVDYAISTALAASPKNLTEHRFAVESLVQQLQTFCNQVDADTEPFSLQLPNLWHLASDVHGVLRDEASALDLAAVLHPTAAVAGTPTEAAKKVIGELEPFDRGRYAGPVGWLGADGDGEWAIALRGAQLHQSTITAFAGCGVVAESDAQSELEETELKFRPIRDALG